MRSIGELLFDIWLEDNHKYFYYILGLMNVIMFLALVTGAIFVLVDLENWRVLGWCCLGAVILRVIQKMYMRYVVNDYHARKFEKKK